MISILKMVNINLLKMRDLNRERNGKSAGYVNGLQQIFVKEIKDTPSGLLSYISTQDFFRTQEKCYSQARATGKCFLHFSCS